MSESEVKEHFRPELEAAGERIRSARRSHGLSQSAMGRMVGVSRWTVLDAEKGRCWSIGTLAALARQIGISLGDLFGGAHQPMNAGDRES